MLEEKLKGYVRKACPKVPADTQRVFAREMRRAVKMWGLADSSEKDAVLEKLRIRLEEKLLGLRPRQASFRLSFSKKNAGDEVTVRNTADKFLDAFSQTVATYRMHSGVPSGQLAFRVDGVDMTHPKLAIVQCVVSDPFLRKSELKRGAGRINRRTAGRPAMLKFNFEGIEEAS